jgi:hypothetical protein
MTTDCVAVVVRASFERALTARGLDRYRLLTFLAVCGSPVLRFAPFAFMGHFVRRLVSSPDGDKKPHISSHSFTILFDVKRSDSAR